MEIRTELYRDCAEEFEPQAVICFGTRSDLKPLADLLSSLSGQNFTVTLQKNLNHWVSSTPGYFTVGVASSAFENYKELARIPDNGEAALTLYTANVNIPMSMQGQAIIQAQYVTKNPNAPAIFYQCSDVNIN
ncbi:uncharacterized protein LOC135463985 [Liolophura sinensis]|uniref:uncharacterized protein LOC135463985 n=1 Tax=Liolophura sinensis TaxID=3198878 RepID=UPI003158AE96